MQPAQEGCTQRVAASWTRSALALGQGVGLGHGRAQVRAPRQSWRWDLAQARLGLGLRATRAGSEGKRPPSRHTRLVELSRSAPSPRVEAASSDLSSMHTASGTIESAMSAIEPSSATAAVNRLRRRMRPTRRAPCSVASIHAGRAVPALMPQRRPHCTCGLNASRTQRFWWRTARMRRTLARCDGEKCNFAIKYERVRQ